MHNALLKNTVVVHVPPDHELGVDGAASGGRVGGKTLAQEAQEANEARGVVAPEVIAPQEAALPASPAPSALVPTPAPVPDDSKRRRFEWIRGLVKAAIVPVVEKAITGAMVTAAPAAAPAAVVAGKTLVQPTLDWLVDQLADIAADPRAFTTAAQNAMSAAWNNPGEAAALAAAEVGKLMPSKGTIGRAARAAVIGGSQIAVQKVFETAAGRLTGHPQLAAMFTNLAPNIGRVFGYAVDIGLDAAVPIVLVAASDVPKQGERIAVCMILPSTVVAAPRERIDGYYDVDVEFADVAVDWFAGDGTATLKLGPEGKIAAVAAPKLALLIGSDEKTYRVNVLTATYGEHDGLEVTGTLSSPSRRPANLRKLTVSPMGWVDGSFDEAGKTGKLGGTAPNGVLAPPPTEEAIEAEPARARVAQPAHDATPKPAIDEPGFAGRGSAAEGQRGVIDRLLGRDGGIQLSQLRFPDEDAIEDEAPSKKPAASAASAAPAAAEVENLDEVLDQALVEFDAAPPSPATPLATSIHSVLASDYQMFASGLLRVAGWATGHRNFAKPRPPMSSAAPLALGSGQDKNARLNAWLAGINPAGVLDAMANAPLVPSWLKTGYPKLSLVANELKIGREPSLSFGMSMSLQLFRQMPTMEANNLVVVWLPNGTPTVRMRGEALSFGDNLSVRGLETDAGGGMHALSAELGLPLPLDVFSIDRIGARAEYLVIGPGVQFRRAAASATGIAIADVIAVDNLALSAVDNGGNPRYSALLEGGRAKLPGAALSFDGNLHWGGGQAMTGHGRVAGGPLSALGGKITATQLAGTVDLDARGLTGSVSATDLIVRWKDYELQVTADVKLDREGVAGFTLARASANKAGKRVGDVLNATYVRDQQLTVGQLVLDVPSTGALRGVRENDAQDAELAVSNLDLSALVRADKGKAPVAPGQAPAAPGISTKNLKRLEIGPEGTKPLLALDFTQAERDRVAPNAVPAPAGTKAAVLSGDLRAFQLPPTLIEVGPSTSGDGVRLALAGIKGDGWAIEQASYDDGVLDVTRASVSFARLLGAEMPRALTGFVPDVTASFAIDTRKGALTSLDIKGEIPGGKMFGDALTIIGASAKLVGVPSALPAASLTRGLTLQGSIKVENATARAYGAEVALKGEIQFPSGDAVLSGIGSAGPIKVDVRGARFGVGPTRFDRAEVQIAAPANDLIHFVATPSNLPLTDEARARVVVIASQVEVDAAGKPIVAATEHVAVVPKTRADQSPPAAAPALEAPPAVDAARPAAVAARVRTSLDVHLPEIHIANDALILNAKEVHKPDVEDGAPVSVEIGAALDVGPLKGKAKGSVKLRLPRRESGAPEAQIAQDPDAAAIEVDIEEATLGHIKIENAHYAAGRLTIASATAPLSSLLAKLPALGLENTIAGLSDVVIDLRNKTIGVGGLSLGAANLSFLGGDATLKTLTATLGLAPAPLDAAALLPASWALTVDAKEAELKILKGMTATGSAKVVLDKTGLLSAQLAEAKIAWGTVAAGVKTAQFSSDGWSLGGLFVELDPGAAMSDLGLDLGGLPAWMPLSGDWLVRATMDLAREKGKPAPTLPGLGNVKLDVIAAGLKLPGIAGSFNRRTRKAHLTAKPPAGEISASAQLPVAQGVGIEIVGAIGQQFALDADVDLGDGDDVAIASAVAASLRLYGRLRIGIFGGVPYLFTVSAGVYAGLELNASISAVASGAWRTPKTAADKPESNLELYMKIAGADGKPAAITGEAGAYAAVKVLGYYKALEKKLAQVELASLHAHGFARLGTATGLTLLPQGGFPAHHLHLHPTLETLLFDSDTKKALVEAQRNVDRGVAKVEASEELLDQHPAEALGPKPWKPQERDLQTAAVTARATVRKDEQYIEGNLKVTASDRSYLEVAKTKLESYERQLAILTLPKEQAAAKLGYSLLDGVVKTRGREALPQANAMARLVDYDKHQGLKPDKVMLDAEQMKTKIKYKKEEIVVLERRIQIDLEDRDQNHTKLALDTDKRTKAERKAELAGKTRDEVREDHERRQDRLLALYDKLETAHALAHKASNRRTQRKEKIIADKEAALAQQKTLAQRGASEAEKQFWAEQVRYLTEEEARLTAREVVPPLIVSPQAATAIKRANQERASQQRAPLDGALSAALELVQREIDALTIDLSQNFQALSKLPDNPASAAERARLEQARAVLMFKLDAAQDKAKAAFAAASE